MTQRTLGQWAIRVHNERVRAEVVDLIVRQPDAILLLSLSTAWECGDCGETVYRPLVDLMDGSKHFCLGCGGQCKWDGSGAS